MKARLLLLGVLVFAFGYAGGFLTGFFLRDMGPPVVPIGKILKNPSSFGDREIWIRGVVKETYGAPLFSQNLYEMDDGTGTLWVLSEAGEPEMGRQVVVRGVLKLGLRVGNRGFGTLVLEKERQYR